MKIIKGKEIIKVRAEISKIETKSYKRAMKQIIFWKNRQNNLETKDKTQ